MYNCELQRQPGVVEDNMARADDILTCMMYYGSKGILIMAIVNSFGWPLTRVITPFGMCGDLQFKTRSSTSINCGRGNSRHWMTRINHSRGGGRKGGLLIAGRGCYI